MAMGDTPGGIGTGVLRDREDTVIAAPAFTVRPAEWDVAAAFVPSPAEGNQNRAPAQ